MRVRGGTHALASEPMRSDHNGGRLDGSSVYNRERCRAGDGFRGGLRIVDRWQAELETALAAAKVGGGIAAGYFEAGLAADVKNAEGEGSFNIVTKADVEAERAIVEVIKRAFPGHAVY